MLTKVNEVIFQYLCNSNYKVIRSFDVHLCPHFDKGSSTTEYNTNQFVAIKQV